MMRKVPYGGTPYGDYVIWEQNGFFHIEKPGYDYPVACPDTYEDAIAWIDENPDGNLVVEEIEEEKAERRREILIDLLCG